MIFVSGGSKGPVQTVLEACDAIASVFPQCLPNLEVNGWACVNPARNSSSLPYATSSFRTVIQSSNKTEQTLCWLIRRKAEHLSRRTNQTVDVSTYWHGSLHFEVAANVPLLCRWSCA